MNLSRKILGVKDSQKCCDATSLFGRFSRAKTLVVKHHYVLASLRQALDCEP